MKKYDREWQEILFTDLKLYEEFIVPKESNSIGMLNDYYTEGLWQRTSTCMVSAINHKLKEIKDFKMDDIVLVPKPRLNYERKSK